MSNEFKFDVFLSYSSKDKAIVRPIAERLRQDGLKIWFDEWMLKPGDSIPAKIEEGLELSRVLVFCMSANAFGSDWARLESGTFRFRDPLNKERRFIPLRLDDTPIKGTLAQFLYINWHLSDNSQGLVKLLEACRPSSDKLTQRPNIITLKDNIIFAHHDSIYAVAITPNGKWVIADTVRSRLEKFKFTKRCDIYWQKSALRRQAESSPLVRGIAITPDCKYAVTCSSSSAVEVWNLHDMKRVKEFHCPKRPATCVAISPDGRKIIAGSYDGSISVWDFASGELNCLIEAHRLAVKAILVTPDGNSIISASEDCTLCVCDMNSPVNLSKLCGHTSGVISLAACRPEIFHFKKPIGIPMAT